MNPLSIFVCIACALVIGYFIGFVCGRSRGTDEGWLERHFEDVARERARHDRQGKFCARKQIKLWNEETK